MLKAKQLPERDKRRRFASLYRQNHSARLISREMHLPSSTAIEWARPLSKIKTTRDEEIWVEQAGTRKKHFIKFSPADHRFVRAHLKHHRKDTVREVTNDLSSSFFDISRATVYRMAAESPRIRRLKVPRKPALTGKQKLRRLRFAIDNEHTPFVVWVFTDEFHVTADQSVRLHLMHFWAEDSSEVEPVPTVKFPAHLSVFAAVCRNRTLPLIFFNGHLNADRYQAEILPELVKNLKAEFGDEEFVLQHDGAPWHTAGSTQAWLQANPDIPHFITPEEWPSNSPDLNLIENLMGTVLRRTAKKLFDRGRPHPGREEFRAALVEEWDGVTQEEIEALYASMPDRLHAVRHAHGGHTRF